MSPLTKIFVILNLVLSVALVSAALPFFAKSQNYREEYEKLKSKHDEQSKELQRERIARQEADRQAEKQAGLLSAQLSAKEDDLFKSRQDLSRVNEERIQLNLRNTQQQKVLAELQQMAAVSAEERRVLQEKADRLGESLARSQELERKAMEMSADLKSRVEDLLIARDELTKKYIKATDESAQLQDVLLKNNISADSQETPLIRGKITGYDQKTGVALISVGENQGVREGFKFKVYRGDKFVGTVQASMVAETFASVTPVSDMMQDTIQVGDLVTTRFPR